MTELNELKRQKDEIENKIKEIQLNSRRGEISKLEEQYIGKAFLEEDGVSETYYYVHEILGTRKLSCIELYFDGKNYSVSEFEEINLYTIENDCTEAKIEDFYRELLNTKNYICNIINGMEGRI